MSTLISLINEAHPLAAGPLPMAGDGLLDWINAKSAAVQVAGRGLSITFGIIFIIWQAISSRGALARVLIAALAAGAFIWVVWNVTELQNRVGNEINAVQVQVAPAPTSRLLL